MKRFNIVVGKKYDHNGEEKTQWNRVGTLVYFPANGDKNEGYRLELDMFPNTKFSVFEEKPREQTKQVEKTTEENNTKTSPSEDYPDGIDTDDIPF